ncbi:alpha-amylase family protein [Microbacterium sp. NE2HP2]|uniref:alpha-amylase family protein n=1 Tax=Microbacterium plantarum TaxID=1816425 RepID=UPI0023672925|nr:alpha-amylase family protein [Microbacterium plantarum]MDD7945771.1 alpha-amylase family protein [Microbacterium plantarum]
MRISDTSDLWWKNAVLYCVDVEKYLDDDGDGDGDLQGLARRLPYLADLGVTCLWLMPFYPTPGRDNGYDVSDYYGVDPRVGSHGDFVELIRTAEDRGIRVIVDLVMNHTSDRHPWFLSARESRDSPYRDFYVWRDEIPDDPRETQFPGEEDGVWEWDEKTGQYYLHSFYAHQPDLNAENPAVQRELAKVMGFWLQLGVSGFRVDAVPSFVSSPERREPQRDHDVLRALRRFAQRRSSAAMLVGEVNVPHDEQAAYFGADGDGELHMQFDFASNQALYLSLAREDPQPLRSALESRPDISTISQWANFVRNHDELTLDQLSDVEREEVFAAFAPEESMQVFGRGIRRRLPPMLGGDPRRIRLVYSLLFSLPGTPVLLYGEEIGMGENLDIDERDAVRVPMQWRPDGGFSTAAASAHPLPSPEGPYGPQHVNVEAQLMAPDSLFAFVRGLARSYRQSPEIGWGDLELVPATAPSVLAHGARTSESRFVAVHNFAGEPVAFEIDLGEEPDGTELVCLASGESWALEGATVSMELDGYGARRLRVTRPGDGRLR